MCGYCVKLNRKITFLKETDYPVTWKTNLDHRVRTLPVLSTCVS